MRSASLIVKTSKLDLSGRLTLGVSTITYSPKTLGAQRRHVGSQIRPATLCFRDCRLSCLHSNNITWPKQLGRRSCCKRNFQCQALESNAQLEQRKDIDGQIAWLAVPTIATLAADPVASLVDTAFIGHLGAVQLAGVGIALSVYSTVTKLFNVPLLSVATSSVATAYGEHGGSHKEVSEAASAVLLLAVIVGLCEGVFLLVAGGPGLGLWGADAASAMRPDAWTYLSIRGLGAPFTVILLVLQGVFRGLGDTKSPLWATLICNGVNVVLDAVFIMYFGWGVRGAAWATIIGQAVAALGLFGVLSRRYSISFKGKAALTSAAKFLGPTGLLVLRTMASTATFALATALTARTDSAHAAAHQICLQLWLASSLLADSLAVAAQTLLARSVAARNSAVSQLIALRVLRWGVLLGVVLGGALGASSGILPKLFTSDPAVLAGISAIYPWVILTQPINALAFVWDGVLYGCNGFKYAAKAMAVCAAPAVSCMLLGLEFSGDYDVQLTSVWLGLSLLMVMRCLTIYIPYRLRRSPFDVMFIKQDGA
ncbi:TPA: hypothetical protein ACH3X3_012329 [Trebouxia sp. C0006]